MNIACAILLAASLARTGDEPMQTQTVVTFEIRDRHVWTAVNDDVMGGVSTSVLQPTEDGTAQFAGTLSLENNGGFASVRAWLGQMDLSDFEGLSVRVRGDGRTYRLRLRTDNQFDGIAYQAQFETREGEWTEVHVPFASFRPTFRGRTPRGAGPLDPARIHQIGFMIADKQPGPFQLEIDRVLAYRTR